MLELAAGLYVVNCVVGLVAQIGEIGFGRWHHALYAVVFVAAVAALPGNFGPGMCMVVAALLLFPRAGARTWWHPLLAVLGLLGYVLTFLART